MKYHLLTSKQLLVKISYSTPSSPVASHLRLVNIGLSDKSIEKDKILREHRDVFEGIGGLPEEYNCEVYLQQSPVIHAPRRIRITIRDTVSKELRQMEENAIIARITELTPTGVDNGCSCV